MSRQSWGFSSLRLKNKRTSDDAFQRRGRLFFQSLRQNHRQQLSSVSEDEGGAAEGENQTCERDKESAKGYTNQDQGTGAMKRLSTVWMSVRGKMSRDRGPKEPESPRSSDAVCVDDQQREPRYTSGQFFFEYLVVVSLKKNKTGTYEPQISYQFPKRDGLVRFQKEEEEKTLKAITLFCFPEGIHWAPLTEYSSETFSFVLTEVDGSRRNGYCRRLLPHGNGARPPEAYCIISTVACFGLFSKIFDEVEKRRQISMAMIYPFMQSLREAPFPAPGNTVQIKSFIPDSGTEIISLTRPTDSWLEHVDFRTLFRCLSDEEVLQVFAATVLERRIIFLAEELGTLSQVIHAVSVLLYPFIWQHTLISIVPQILIDVVMAPTPYLLGVQKPLADEVIDQGDLLVVDLSEGRKKTFIRRVGDEESILPHKLREEMLQALRNRSDGSSLEELNRIVPEAFLPFFIKSVGHFPKHMVRSSAGSADAADAADAAPHFNTRNFCKAVESKSIRHFVKQFVQTQMFDLFIQEVEQRPASQTGFFERKISEYHRKMREKVKKH